MSVVPIRPCDPDVSVERLWSEWREAADTLEAEVATGSWKIETAARCVDLYRAWCRAYCGVVSP